MLQLVAVTGFLVRVHVSRGAEARVQHHAQLARALGQLHLRSRRGHVTCHVSHYHHMSHSYHIVTVTAAEVQ